MRSGRKRGVLVSVLVLLLICAAMLIRYMDRTYGNIPN